jgi:signal peptidase I
MTAFRVFRLVVLLTVGLPLFFFSGRSAVFDWYRQSSGSMLPTIVPGTTGIAVLKCAYQVRVPFTAVRLFRTGAPSRGDIVVLRNPDGKPNPFIKRLVGLPGDVIELQNEVLIVNGVRAPLRLKPAAPRAQGEEAFTAETSISGHAHEVLILPSRPALRDFGPITVPPNEVFVLGDNRDESRDSRFFGTRPVDDLLGRVVFIPGRA